MVSAQYLRANSIWVRKRAIRNRNNTETATVQIVVPRRNVQSSEVLCSPEAEKHHARFTEHLFTTHLRTDSSKSALFPTVN